jgi:hypothetical protein
MSSEGEVEVALSLDPPPRREEGGDPEIAAVARRRRFTTQYKLSVLREADRCRKPGELGALVRREGLYSSHLVTWREARRRGELTAHRVPKRGRRADPDRALKARIAQLEREIERLQAKLEQAEGLIEVQKKLSVLLGLK